MQQRSKESKSKVKFYTGIFVAVLIGVLSASGLAGVFTYSSNFIRSEIYANNLDAWSADGLGAGKLGDRDVVAPGQYTTLSGAKDFPNISADAYLVADFDSADIIAQESSDAVYPIASITKLMTGVLALETIEQEEIITIGPDAVLTHGRQGKLSVGDELSAEDLLYPLLLESSNDTAEALAIYRGRDFFIRNMNHKKDVLGLYDTGFSDPSGLSNWNVSTANDLFKMARYIDDEYDYLFYLTKQKNHRASGISWYNNNPFVRYDGYLGGKHGYTDEARHTALAIFDLPLAESDTRRIAIILLQSEDIEDDVDDILLYLLQNIYFEVE